MKAIALWAVLLRMLPQNVGCEFAWNVMAHWHALHAECATGAVICCSIEQGCAVQA